MTNDSTDEPTDESSPQNPNLGILVLPRFDPAILVKESEKKLSAIRDELSREIKPKSFIERMYVDDMARIICEMQQLRSFKSRFIRHNMQAALKILLQQVIVGSTPMESKLLRQDAEKLAEGWLGNKKDQTKIEKLFTAMYLDEVSIEAEAWRLVSADLDRIERMLTSLENRRDKVLKAIANYRGSLAIQLKQAARRISEADEAVEETVLLS
jgi:hypothetical protein